MKETPEPVLPEQAFLSDDHERMIRNFFTVSVTNFFYCIYLVPFEFGFAVNTAIDAVFAIRQFKLMRKLLLDRSDTSWVLTTDDVCNFIRKL